MSPAAASASSTSRSWSPKQYLLVALAGTLVAAVIVVAVSAVLSPAAISFSVVNATHVYTREPRGMLLSFTILAVNPGWRAGVNYTSFGVDLVYTSSNRSEWGTTERVLPSTYSSMTRKGTQLPIEQRPRNSTYIMALLFIGDDDWTKYMANGKEKTTPMSVQVRATVRFLVWRVKTRSYHIAVLCHLNLTLFTNAVVSYDNNHTAPCVDAGLISSHPSD
uniref:Late embryogenesis abundant protein LEA-2 subgroup domain-containing protein n=1 Tax=Oryza punctata TaxID=4537 RepID=A0A0E0L749_ORYPU